MNLESYVSLEDNRFLAFASFVGRISESFRKEDQTLKIHLSHFRKILLIVQES